MSCYRNYMKQLVILRREKGLSQRRLALLAGLSYKTIQLIEAGEQDVKISSLSAIAKAYGYPSTRIDGQIENLFTTPPDSVRIISEEIHRSKKDSWKIYLFNFVDAFRRSKNMAYVMSAPVEDLTLPLKALLTSTVETLCQELHLNIPWWCSGMPPLKSPWFVSGIENLKASALMESPIHFRKRNIFVLNNFLERR